MNQRPNLKRAVATLNVVTLVAITPGGAGLLLALRPAVAMASQTAPESDDAPPPPPLALEQIDQLVAPIALYPDPLLAQVLAAATFPMDVVQAERWAVQNKNLKGQQLTDAVVQANLPYDPSVISLIQFPAVLEKLSHDLDWTNALGNAVLIQRGDVMDAVQRMRRKAEQAGNLKTGPEIKVVSSPTVIEIQPTNPQVIYVPTYSPQVVYAPAPPGAVVATGLLAFGAGVAVGAAINNGCCWYGGRIGWSTHTVVVANAAFSRNWYTRRAIPPPPPYYRPGGPYPRGRAPVPGRSYPNRGYRGNTNGNNVNINVNNSRNNSVNRNTNAANVNSNRSTKAGNTGTVNRNPASGSAARNNVTPKDGNQNSVKPADRSGNSPPGARPVERGYNQGPSGRASAFSGAQNGRSEAAASRRGQAARKTRGGNP